jgi:eukaryotic-like serine/threonine-protein kinase
MRRCRWLVAVGLLLPLAVGLPGRPGTAQERATNPEAVGDPSAPSGSAVLLGQTNWARYRFDVHSTGYNRFENVLSPSNVDQLRIAWTFTTGSYVGSSPALVDGTVYIGSDDDNVYALDASTGVLKWSFLTDGDVSSSPAVADGVVYVGSDDDHLYALDASTGAMRWSFPARDDVTSSPVVAYGLVYVGSDDNNVYALDAVTGTMRWRFRTTSFVHSSPAVAGAAVVVGSADRSIYSLDYATGYLHWSFDTGFTGVLSSPAVADHAVYADGDDRRFYALNALNGTELWTFGNGVTGSPAAANGAVYVAQGSILYALDSSTGAMIWNTRVGNEQMESGAALANGLVYVTNVKSVFVLDAATGDLLMTLNTRGSISSSPVVANGRVFVGSGDGLVYAFGLP